MLRLKTWFSLLLISTACQQEMVRDRTEQQEENEPKIIVFYTEFGKKYHLEHCSYLNGTPFFCPFPEAVENGLTPCSRCFPDSVSSTSIRTTRKLPNNGQQQQLNTSGDPIQCKGITRRGTRCKRSTRQQNGFCFQHQSQYQ